MPNPGFKVTPFTLFFDAEYLRSGTTYRQFQWNTNKDSHTPYNDTKRRAVSATAELLVLLAKGQCCSVIASVTFVNHVKTNKRIFKIFYHRTTILVFPYQTSWHYSDGDPLKGASNARGYEKWRFRPISRFIFEMMQDTATVTMEGE